MHSHEINLNLLKCTNLRIKPSDGPAPQEGHAEYSSLPPTLSGQTLYFFGFSTFSRFFFFAFEVAFRDPAGRPLFFFFGSRAVFPIFTRVSMMLASTSAMTGVFGSDFLFFFFADESGCFARI